jgi:MFS family permease
MKGARMLAQMIMDVTPLRTNQDFRRLWIGQSLSSFGGQLTVYAVMLQAYRMTGSTLAVGGVGLVFVLPSVTVALLAGGLIDAHDRRKIVLVTSSLQAGVSVLLAVQAYSGLASLAVIYVLVGCQGGVGAINAPARGTFMPRLLAKDQLHAGAALETFSIHVSTVAGPATAGLISGFVDLRMCYVVDSVSFCAALYGVARLPVMKPEGASGRVGIASAIEGLRYVTRTRMVGQAFLADMSLTVLGTPTALLPALNVSHFGGRAEVLGLLLAAPALGGILGAGCSGIIGRICRQGRAMIALCLAWGVVIASLGISPWADLTIVFLVIAGALDAMAVILRTAVIQASTPDRMRGRVESLDYIVGVGGPQLGTFRAGALGSLLGPSLAAIVGGLSTAVTSGALLTFAKQLNKFERPAALDSSSEVASQ